MIRPKRKASPIDPYVAVTPAGKTPPAPAPPSTEPHLLTIRVPRPESSILEMGAGGTPGIRLESGTHVHLSARAPLSTISLGSPAAGTAGSGIGMVTDGELNTTITQKADEHFKNTRLVTVDLDAEWKCMQKLTETVHGDAKREHMLTRTQIVHGDSLDTLLAKQTTNITGDHIVTSKTKDETVTGTYNLSSGVRTEHVHGKLTVDMHNNDFEVKDCMHFKVRVSGDETKKNFHNIKEIHVGHRMTACLGTRSDLVTGLTSAANLAKIEVNGTKMERSRVKWATSNIELDKRQISIKKKLLACVTVGLWVMK
jgi:hypothetical protein